MSPVSTLRRRHARTAAAAAALVTLLGVPAAAHAAPFTALYNWQGGATDSAGWTRDAIGGGTPYSASIGPGGIRVRPTGNGGQLYNAGSRDGYEFTAPGASTISRADLQGVDGLQADAQRARIYLAPEPGDDLGLTGTESWGKETPAEGSTLPGSFALTPAAGYAAPNTLRVYLRTLECGNLSLMQPLCGTVPAASTAHTNLGRVALTLDDPSAPSGNLATSARTGWTNQSTVALNFTASDGESGIARVNYTATRATPASGVIGQATPDTSGKNLPQLPSSANPTATVTLPTSGSVALGGSIVNGAGQTTATNGITVQVDRLQPKITLPRKLAGGQTMTVSDAVSGLKTSGIASVVVTVGGKNATATKPCAGGARTCSLRLPSNGGHLSATATDVAGNVTTTGADVPGAPSKGTKSPGTKKPSNPGTHPKKPKAPTKHAPTAKSCPKGQTATAGGNCKSAPSAAYCTAHPNASKCKGTKPSSSSKCSTSKTAICTPPGKNPKVTAYCKKHRTDRKCSAVNVTITGVPAGASTGWYQVMATPPGDPDSIEAASPVVLAEGNFNTGDPHFAIGPDAQPAAELQALAKAAGGYQDATLIVSAGDKFYAQPIGWWTDPSAGSDTAATAGDAPLAGAARASRSDFAAKHKKKRKKKKPSTTRAMANGRPVPATAVQPKVTVALTSAADVPDGVDPDPGAGLVPANVDGAAARASVVPDVQATRMESTNPDWKQIKVSAAGPKPVGQAPPSAGGCSLIPNSSQVPKEDDDWVGVYQWVGVDPTPYPKGADIVGTPIPGKRGVMTGWHNLRTLQTVDGLKDQIVMTSGHGATKSTAISLGESGTWKGVDGSASVGGTTSTTVLHTKGVGSPFMGGSAARVVAAAYEYHVYAWHYTCTSSGGTPKRKTFRTAVPFALHNSIEPTYRVAAHYMCGQDAGKGSPLPMTRTGQSLSRTTSRSNTSSTSISISLAFATFSQTWLKNDDTSIAETISVSHKIPKAKKGFQACTFKSGPGVGKDHLYDGGNQDPWYTDDSAWLFEYGDDTLK